MKKPLLFKLFTLTFALLMWSSVGWGQGLEDFTNSNATGSYSDNSFEGNDGITWTYVESRDGNSDANSSGIDLPALMLRWDDDPSSITSNTISGGIGNFSVKLYKGFTGGGDRQVELFVNGVSQGTSTPFDDFDEHIFEVNGINIGGDIVISIVNVTPKQVIIDDITWTGYEDTDPPVPTFDPAAGATGVAIDVNPTISFDEAIYITPTGDPIDDTNVESLLTFTDGVDAVPFTATITNNVITVVPDANLANDQIYTLTMAPVEDELGNAMANPAAASFTTIAENAPVIDLTSTHAGDTYYGGEDVTVTWTSNNVTTLDLQVWLPVDGIWQTIETGLTAADGTVTTVPPVDIDYATTYKLRLKDADTETYSDESGEFTLIPVLPIHEIQSNADVDGNSSYVNDFVKTGGRVSAVRSTDNFFIQAGLGEFSGINVYEASHGLAVGDSIVIEAKVGEQYDMTQLSSVVTIANHGNFEPWDATTIATGDMGEAWECVLVTVENAEVIDNTLGYEEFSVNDGSGDVVVDDAIYSYDLPDNGRLFASITGPVEYSYGAFKILPRTVDDFILLSNDATLSTFTLGGQDVTGLTDLEVADPVNDAGATLYVADMTGFEGIGIDATDAAATVTVELNGTEVVEGDYATQALADGDVVVATVEAEDGTMAYYKVTLIEENRVLEITGPTLPATYATGDDVTFTWNATNIDTVNIYVVDTEEAHLINEEGVIDATLGTYTYTIANGDFGTFTIRITDASDETFFDETTEEVTVDDILHPEGVEYYPEMGAIDVPVSFTLSVLFDEDVAAGTGNFTIYKASDNSEVVNFTEADFTIDYDMLTVEVSGLDYETEYYILADAGIIEDLSGNATPVLDDPTVWTFTTMVEPDYELYFSEYIEGSSNNKAIEIYNPGNTDVDLTPYVVKLASNGGDWSNTLDLTGTLKAGDVYVIANSGADQAILDVADETSNVTYYNGNDALGLFNSDVLIDVIGTQGEDAYWDVAGVTSGLVDHTIIRKEGLYAGNTNWTESAGTNADNSEWIVYDLDYFDDLGTHYATLSDEAEILEFTFGPSIDYEDAVIESGTATVDIIVIKGTDVNALAPSITVSEGATINPASGDIIDFTNPVTFTVTAEDGVTTKDWTVTVTESAVLSDKANITDVQLAGVDSIKINDTDATVMIYAPYGFDVTTVKPEFTVSAGATIADTAAARDFTNLQVYDVTAQDESTTKNWEVSMITAEPMELTIYDIQYTDEASGDSPYLDALVKTSGIVTGVGGDGFFMQAKAEEWNGIYVYAPDDNTATLGDSAWVVGTVDEYNNGTQISYVKDYIIIEQGVTLPEPIVISDLATTLTESHEGMLVQLIDIECTDGPSNFQEWTFEDESGDQIKLDDILGYQHTFTIGSKYSITGLRQTYFGDKITPRDANDINEAPSISGITLDPTTPSSSDDVTISATVTDDHTGVADLTVALFYGDAEGAEDTEVTFAQVGTTDEFEGVIPASDAEVFYKITASDGDLTSTLTGSYSIATNINNPDGIVSLNVYPNPNKGEFTLEMNARKAGTFHVEIINMLGQVVYQKQISQDGFYRESIDISDKASGLYYIKMSDGTSEKVAKILIQ